MHIQGASIRAGATNKPQELDDAVLRRLVSSMLACLEKVQHIRDYIHLSTHLLSLLLFYDLVTLKTKCVITWMVIYMIY